jgi:hypothetical protein
MLHNFDMKFVFVQLYLKMYKFYYAALILETT